MGYNITPTQDDCYPGTSVLINKLDIRTQAQLDENELVLTSAKILQVELEPVNAKPDFAYLKQLHHIVFGELYDWAGTIRTINMSKLRTAFCPADQIEPLAAEIFSRLQSMHYFRDCSRAELVSEFADLYDSLNYLHPFREGNGRVQRLYFRQLARWIGHSLNFAAIDSDRMMIATIHASAGIMDGLQQIFDEILD